MPLQKSMVLGKIYICENKKIKFQNALFTAARRFAGLWKVRKRHIVFYSRYASVCRKRYRSCTNCTKSLGELLCPKRSTGTFWRVSLLGYVKRGGQSGEANFTYASPRNAFAFLTPCSVFFFFFFWNKGISLSADSDEGLHPSTPPPLKRWTKLLLLSLFVQLFSFCCFFNKLSRSVRNVHCGFFYFVQDDILVWF